MKIARKFSIISGILIALTTAIIMLLTLTIMYKAMERQANLAQENAMNTMVELLAQKGSGFDAASQSGAVKELKQRFNLLLK